MGRGTLIQAPQGPQAVKRLDIKPLLWAALFFLSSIFSISKAHEIEIDSLVASAHLSGHTTVYTRSQFERALDPSTSPTSHDRRLALAIFVLASELDRRLLVANKFERVPEYRVTHALKALIAANRLHPSESDPAVYDRLVRNWKKSCEPRIAAGRGCDFSFHFNKSDWERGQPNFSSRVDPSMLRSFTRESSYSRYRSQIHDMANTAAREGYASAVIAGQVYELNKKTTDTPQELLNRAIDAWHQARLDIQFFFVSPENARKYFNTSESVIFRRFDVPREIRQHEWDGFSFRLPQAPPRYQDFVSELRKHLNTIYLFRTRRSMMQQHISRNTSTHTYFVSSRELHKKISQSPAFSRKGRFAFLSIPLPTGDDGGAVARAASDVAEAFAARHDSQGVQEIFESLAEELREKYRIDALSETLSVSGRHSALLPMPQEAQEAQMHHLLFASEIAEQAGFSPAQTPDLVYFIDRQRSALVFCAAVALEATQALQLDPTKDRTIDRKKLEHEIVQSRFAQTYSDLVLRTLKETSIRVLDPNYLEARQEISLSHSSINPELEQRVLSFVEQFEGHAPGLGWAQLMERIYWAPVEAKDLRSRLRR
jgi:hypothetical protein